MFRTSILAVSTIAAFTLFTPALLSQAVAAPGVAGPPIIVIPVIPVDPGVPGNPGGGGGGNGGSLPVPPVDEQIAQLTENCNASLGTLVKVPVKMVETFDGLVRIIPVCGYGLGKQANIDAAQALPLQDAIGANAALNGPLRDDGLTADDVVGVVLLKGAATLYVHPRA